MESRARAPRSTLLFAAVPNGPRTPRAERANSHKRRLICRARQTRARKPDRCETPRWRGQKNNAGGRVELAKTNSKPTRKIGLANLLQNSARNRYACCSTT
eukprot:3588182-Lingulodinium_polyedra.AAC.1